MARVNEQKIRKTCPLIRGLAFVIIGFIPPGLAVFWANPFQSAIGSHQVLQDLLGQNLITRAFEVEKGRAEEHASIV